MTTIAGMSRQGRRLPSAVARFAASASIRVSVVCVGVGISLILASPLGAQPQAPAATVPAQATAPASPDAGSNLAAVLAMPVSRASIAMLVDHPVDPTAARRLSEALQDPRPDVRAVAARVAYVNKSSTLVGVLTRAVTAERDPLAQREELRALALIGNSTTDSVALDTARSLGFVERLNFLVTFARARPAAFGAHVDDLFTPEEDAASLIEPLAAALPQDAAWLTPLLERAATQSGWWQHLLEGLDPKHARFREAIAIGMGSPDERVRALTVWHTASLIAAGRELPEQVMTLVDTRAPQAAAGSIEVFAFDLLGRARNQKRVADWSDALRQHATWLGKDWPVSDELGALLTKSEYDAWSLSATGKKGLKPREAEAYVKSLKLLGPLRRMRTLPALNSALLADLMTATGCKPPRQRDDVAAVLTYRPDGRLERVQFVAPLLSPACEQAAAVATKLTATYAPFPRPPDAVDIVYPFLNADIVACAAATVGDVPASIRDNDPDMTWPVKKREVTPDYPRRLLRSPTPIAGAVLLRAVVSTTGCVSEAEVLSGLHPDMDLEALNAATQWKFGPALMHGTTPQAVDIRIEVAFKTR